MELIGYLKEIEWEIIIKAPVTTGIVFLIIFFGVRWFYTRKQNTVREQLKQAGKNQEKISPEVKSIIKQKDLPEKISALFLGESKINANYYLPL